MSAEVCGPRFRSVVGGAVELRQFSMGFMFTEAPLWRPTVF